MSTVKNGPRAMEPSGSCAVTRSTGPPLPLNNPNAVAKTLEVLWRSPDVSVVVSSRSDNLASIISITPPVARNTCRCSWAILARQDREEPRVMALALSNHMTKFIKLA